MRHFTATDGARLAYRDDGDGPPLLCLAGLTRSGGDFDYLAPHLLPDVRLIRPDYRGRGESEWTGAETYTVPREAADAVELLDHLGLGAVPILGTSRGGLIGLFLAAKEPSRVAGLAFNDVGPEIAQPGLDKIFGYVGRNPTARTHAEAAEAMARTMEGFEGVPAERWAAEARRHYRQTDDGLEIPYDPALRKAFLTAFEGEAPDLWPAFDTLAGKPVALIRGANSDLLTPKVAADMHARRPDMIFAEVPGRGHVPFLDERESLDAIRAFLARIA